MDVVALVGDLMDQSRLSAAVPDARFTATIEACTGADVVVVDLGRHAAMVAEIRRRVPGARIVAFGPHVDTEAIEAARAAGADLVLPRSRFFRDPATWMR